MLTLVTSWMSHIITRQPGNSPGVSRKPKSGFVCHNLWWPEFLSNSSPQTCIPNHTVKYIKHDIFTLLKLCLLKIEHYHYLQPAHDLLYNCLWYFGIIQAFRELSRHLPFGNTTAVRQQSKTVFVMKHSPDLNTKSYTLNALPARLKGNC